MRAIASKMVLLFAVSPTMCFAQPFSAQQPRLVLNPQPAIVPQQLGEEEPGLAEVGVRTKKDEVGRYLPQGDRISVQVTASKNTDIFVYSIHLQADGKAVLQFPNLKARDNRVPAGTRRWILDDRTPLGFQVGAPFGPEMVRVLVATQPLGELEKLIEENPETVPELSAEEAKKLNAWCEAGAKQGAWEIHETEFEAREAGIRHLPKSVPVVQ